MPAVADRCGATSRPVAGALARGGWGALARGGWGLLLLAAPGRLPRVAGGADTPAVRVAARLLGARHVAEALILSATQGRPARRWIIGVDAIHAASMVALATVSVRLRRDALLSAAATALLIALTRPA